MKKKLIIIFSIIFSFFLSLCYVKSIINDYILLIEILLTLIGLSITAYTFIFVPIKNFSNSNNLDKIKILMKELKDNIKFLFYSVLVFLFIHFCMIINFPFLKNPLYLDFGLFTIMSLKHFVFDFISGIVFFLDLYSFFDLSNAIFILIDYLLLNKDYNE